MVDTPGERGVLARLGGSRLSAQPRRRPPKTSRFAQRHGLETKRRAGAVAGRLGWGQPDDLSLTLY